MSKVMTLMNELIELISMGPFGSDIKVDNFINEGVPVLNGSNVSSIKLIETSFKYVSPEKAKDLKKANAKRGDIVITHRGTVGQISYIPENSKYDNYVISQSQFRVSLKRDIVDPIFFTYYFHTEEGQKRLLSFKSHVGVPALAQATTNFRLLEFPLIPLSEQQKIAKILSDLDAKIELNNKINSELEAMAKTLYDYWFVQFDFPDANGKPYKTSGGTMVYNDELKREIPEDWDVDSLSSWIKNDKSGDWGKEQDEGNYNQKVYCIRGADINGLNGKGYMKTPERYILEKNLHKTLDPYDLIVEISGGSPVQSTGRLAYITEETLHRFDAPIICSNFCKAVTLKNKHYFYNFVYQWNSVYDAGVLFGYEGKTSGIKNLLFESFVSSYQTAIPPKELAEKFYEFMKPIQIKKEKNLKENQELASLRDWLLPMLMNGQVSVGEVAKDYVVKDEVLDMVAEPTYKHSKVVKLFNEDDLEEEYYEKRKALAIYIINKSLNDVYFGDTKLMKLLHLSDYHSIKRNFGQNYYQNVAGPFDGEFKNRFIKDIIDEGLFTIEKPNKKYIFKKGVNHKDSLSVNDYFSHDEIKKVDSLITYFSNENYNRPEIFSTLYAVWNNRLIKKQEVTPKLLKQDFLNWDDQKKQYEDQIFSELDTMKMLGIIPDGWGRYIRRAKK